MSSKWNPPPATAPGSADLSKDIPHPEKSGLFLYLNANKRGITLDMKNAAGKKPFTTGQMGRGIYRGIYAEGAKKLGIDYKTLHRINPALVVTSITYFGQTGPYSDYKAQT